MTRTADGTLVKSSIMVLRDSSGAVFGALCVNLDVTAVDRAHALLGPSPGPPAPPPKSRRPPSATTSTPWSTPSSKPTRCAGTPAWAALDRERRLELFRDLDGRGVFAVRRSVEHDAARLGISRASAYHYLAQARAVTGPAADTP
ncbi:PAS domain-containing protein [Streptomyces violaceorubidus]